MVANIANPNSSLLFDFPDPTPRFDFGFRVPEKTTATPTKKPGKGRRFGRFGKSRSKDVSGSPDTCVDASRADTATTADMSWQDMSWAADASDCDDFLPSPQGSAASGATQYKLFDDGDRLDLLPSRAQRKAAGQGGGTSPRSHRRSRSSASGYISEATPDGAASRGSSVSEFSFDRVTVGTNETSTGLSSGSVDWAFADDPALRALGADGIVPYLGDATAAPPGGDGGAPPAEDISVSSCSDDGHGIPLTGIVRGGGQSVVSEISEEAAGRGGGARGSDAESEAVRALLAGAEPHAVDLVRRTSSGGGASSASRGGTDRVTVTTKPSGGHAAASGEPGAAQSPGPGEGFFPDMMSTYAEFKRARSRAKPGAAAAEKKAPSLMSAVLEDLQFCTLWFCGVDTTSDGVGREEVMTRKRRAAAGTGDEDTLLGRVISCGPQCALL